MKRNIGIHAERRIERGAGMDMKQIPGIIATGEIKRNGAIKRNGKITAKSLPRCIAIILFALFSAGNASGQFGTLQPMYSNEALPMAEAEAKSLLSHDAELVLIGGVGDEVVQTPAGPMQLQINADSGTSSAWAYVFYSPSLGRRITIASVKIPVLGMQVFENESPVPIPSQIVTPLDTKLPFATSGAMSGELRRNAVYARYRQELPQMQPKTIALREILSSDTLVPETMPIDAPIWSLEFSGAGSARMICYVSARTGETFCLRATDVASADATGIAADASARMSVASDAGDGVLHVIVEGVSQSSPLRDAALYNVAGERLLEPTTIERTGNGWSLTFDIKNLPQGIYYCRATGTTWNSTIGLNHR